MKRLFCSKCDAPLRKKVICYSCGYNNEHLAHKMKCRRILKVIMIIILVVGSIMLCNGLLLFPWQFEARKNKKAILDYAEKKFPNAKIIDEIYSSTKFTFTSNPSDSIVFEQNGVTFSIWANDGEFWGEDFFESKANQHIENMVLKPFWDNKGFRAEYSIYMPSSKPVGELAEHKDCIYITIFLEYDGELKPPNDFDCFYDFYLYWIEKSDIHNYNIDIKYGKKKGGYYNLIFTEKSEFKDKSDFYNSFDYILC